MSENDGHSAAPGGLVVICTRNRAQDLARALDAVAATTSGVEVLVADASEPHEATAVRATLERHEHAILVSCSPGLARQRNQAIDWVETHRPGTQFLFFIDDDTEVLPGYFDAVVSTFEENPDVAGVGGVVLNHPRPRHVGVKRLFYLYGPTPGRVLPSGRATIGHYEGDEATNPQCLPGCAMSYRLSQIRGRRFDDRLEGYSLGEDLYFSFALSAEHRLAIAPDARVLHHFSDTNRLSRDRLQRDKTALLHRFVRENRHRDLRPAAFWWSVLGDALLRLGDGLVRRDGDAIAESRSILRSAAHTWRHPLPSRPRSAAPS